MGLKEVRDRFNPPNEEPLTFFEISFGINPEENNKEKLVKLAKGYSYLVGHISPNEAILSNVNNFYKYFEKLYSSSKKPYHELYNTNKSLTAYEWINCFSLLDKFDMETVRSLKDNFFDILRNPVNTADESNIKFLTKAEYEKEFPSQSKLTSLDNGVVYDSGCIYSYKGIEDKSIFWYPNLDIGITLIKRLRASVLRSRNDKELKIEYFQGVGKLMVDGVLQPRDVVVSPMVINANMLRGVITAKYGIGEEAYTDKAVQKILVTDNITFYVAQRKLKLTSGGTARVVLAIQNDL